MPRDEMGAGRAIDDPVELARVARIVRSALARQGLTLSDLAPAGRPARTEARAA